MREIVISNKCGKETVKIRGVDCYNLVIKCVYKLKAFVTYV